jgi:predicted transcriptional regulator
MVTMKEVTLGVKLEAALQRRLKLLGVQKDRSAHWLAKTAIKEFLDREEKRVQERRQDDARWSEYQDTHVAYLQSEVEPWLEQLAKGKYKPWSK